MIGTVTEFYETITYVEVLVNRQCTDYNATVLADVSEVKQNAFGTKP